jgi:hypothetical protein
MLDCTYNPSYLRGGDRHYLGLKPGPDESVRPYLTNKLKQNGLGK